MLRSYWIICLPDNQIFFKFILDYQYKHVQLHGLEFEQTLGNSRGQRSLACCNPQGRKESDTTWQLNNNINLVPMYKTTYFRSEWLCELILCTYTNYPAPDLNKTKPGPLCPAAPTCNVIKFREFSPLLISF